MEQLIHNVAEWLREDIKQIKLVPWPPRVEELEEEEKLSPLVLRLLSALRGRSFSMYSNTHFSSHAICHEATYNNFHQCQHHPSWDDSQ